jgi:2-iminobutanoate/2-iminopropanoate deaminase
MFDFIEKLYNTMMPFNRSYLSAIKNVPSASGPFSQAVCVGNILYISGTVAKNPDTGIVIEGTIEDETRQTLKNIGNILEAVGASYANVVKTTVLLTDINDWAAMNTAYKEFFPANYPARTAYPVKDLASGAHIEIDAIAVLGKVDVKRHQ